MTAEVLVMDGADAPRGMDWAGVLTPGERVLWQGRPDAGLFVTLGQVARFARAVVAIAAFFYILNRLWLTIPPLWDVRMIVLFIFLQAVPTEVILSALRRRRSDYMLTDRRMLVAVDLPLTGWRVQSAPVLAGTGLEVVTRGRWSGLWIAGPKRRWWDVRSAPRVGFERVENGAALAAMIAQAQQGGRDA